MYLPPSERPYSELDAERLLGLCANGGNLQAWDEFMRRFHTLIIMTVHRTIRRYTQPTFELAEQLTRQVYVRLTEMNARTLRACVPRGDCAITGFLKVVAANVVHEHFRGKGTLRVTTSPQHSKDHSLKREIDEHLLTTSSSRARLVFWLFYRDGMTPAEIPNLGLLE